MNILIVVPQLASPARGDRVTAERWGRIFRDLGHDVVFAHEYREQSCDVLVALHAVRSASSIAAFAAQHGALPLVVALTGTDIYPGADDPGEGTAAAAARSMESATRLVAMQPLALDEIPAEWRDKATVILQSLEPPSAVLDGNGAIGAPRGFEVCVVGELRDIKDPFRTALAARRLPNDSRVRIVQLGAAGKEAIAERAAKEEHSNPRYSWLGEVPRDEALSMIARCALVVNTSLSEGSPNVLTEALALGTPILATRVPGNVGILGDDYPGLFAVQDSEALSELITRAESDPEFYEELRKHGARLAERADPQRERQAWKELLDDLGATG